MIILKSECNHQIHARAIGGTGSVPISNFIAFGKGKKVFGNSGANGQCVFNGPLCRGSKLEHVMVLFNSLIFLLLFNASSSFGSVWGRLVPIETPKATDQLKIDEVAPKGVKGTPLNEPTGQDAHLSSVKSELTANLTPMTDYPRGILEDETVERLAKLFGVPGRAITKLRWGPAFAPQNNVRRNTHFYTVWYRNDGQNISQITLYIDAKGEIVDRKTKDIIEVEPDIANDTLDTYEHTEEAKGHKQEKGEIVDRKTKDIIEVEPDIANDILDTYEYTEEAKGHKQEKWYLLWGLELPRINHPEPTRSLIDASKHRKGATAARVGQDGPGIYIRINQNLMAGLALNFLGEVVEDGNGFGVGVFLINFGASVWYFPTEIGRGWFLRGDLGQAEGARINSGPVLWSPGAGNENDIGTGIVFRVGAGYSLPITRGTRIVLSINFASWGLDEGTWRTMGFSLAGLF